MNGARMKNWAATSTCARRSACSEKSRDPEKRQGDYHAGDTLDGAVGPKAISAIEPAISPAPIATAPSMPSHESSRVSGRFAASPRCAKARGRRGWPLPLGRLPHRAPAEPRAGADALARGGKDAIGAGQDLPQPRDEPVVDLRAAAVTLDEPAVP
jgi:hypothetical protein